MQLERATSYTRSSLTTLAQHSAKANILSSSIFSQEDGKKHVKNSIQKGEHVHTERESKTQSFSDQSQKHLIISATGPWKSWI